VVSRLITIAALVAAFVLVAVLLFGGDGGHKYRLMFQTAGQLVPDNQVLIGGAAAGSVESIELTPDNQAEVVIKVDDQLHEGTTAVIRTPSLSTVAGRYISIVPGPDNAPALDDDATLAGDETTTPVDLDQLFGTFTPRTRKGLQGVIQGFAAVYAGKGKQANAAYKYFAPALSSTDRLLKELSSDQRVLTDFLVNGGKVVSAVAQKRDQLTSLVSNANTALGAIASENASLDTSLQLLPPTLRQANTTFVNLRAALDDLDPLVNTSKKATKNLNPFLLKLRPVVNRAVPVFTDLRRTVKAPDGSNPLADLVRASVPLHKFGRPASKTGIASLNASQPVISFIRPYAPELLSSFARLGQVSGYYDADGKYARVQNAAFNLFEWNSVTSNLDPIPLADKFDGFTTAISTRCPGGATQPITGSNPFTDQGKLAGKCNPADVPPGP
jgi:phospholipid/cholesterol/gamma-HCH transport system substrate-binding protein